MADKERKTQSPDAVAESIEIEASNAAKVLRGTGEADTNPHESAIGGRKIGKLEDFWYRHKWHAGITVSAVILGVVLLVQLITHVKPDVYIMYTGPQPIVGAQYERLEDAILSVMDDVNGDGKKAISFADNMYITPKKIEERRSANPNYTYDAAANSAALQRYQMEMTAAKHMICMLDAELFDEMAEAGAFVPLYEIFDGKTISSAYGEYGIRLGDTEFYKSNPNIQYMPADTVIGLRQPGALDLKNDEKKAAYLERHKAVFISIALFEKQS